MADKSQVRFAAYTVLALFALIFVRIVARDIIRGQFSIITLVASIILVGLAAYLILMSRKWAFYVTAILGGIRSLVLLADIALNTSMRLPDLVLDLLLAGLSGFVIVNHHLLQNRKKAKKK